MSTWALSKRLQAAIAVAIAGLAVVVIFVVVPFARQHADAQASLGEATPAPVPPGFFKPTDEQWRSFTIAPVKVLPFPTVDETDGTIAAADDATTQVFSPYTGRVTAVYATTGDFVRAGAPLFTVQGNEYAQAQNDLAAALQTLRAARTQLQVTSANRDRLLALQRVGGAAAKDVEQSAADLATARTNVRNDETAVALVRSRLRVLGVSDATVNQLGNTGSRGVLKTGVDVPAPISGIVTQRALGLGQNVNSAADGATDALLTIADLSHVLLVAAVPETEIANMHVGDPVSVQLLAFPGRRFDARVRYIAPSVDPTTHRIFVRSEIANPDGSLRPGMYGSMTIETGPPQTLIGVPEDAVIFEGDTARVWITGPNKTLALRYLRVGDTVDGLVQVRSGLRPGDHVVTSGSIFIDRAATGGD